MSDHKFIPAHVRGLQSELDSGCDDVVQILADALEDEGDSDAAAVFRIVVAQGYKPGRKGITSFWVCDPKCLSPSGLHPMLFNRLTMGSLSDGTWDEPATRWYLHRSQAYVDLGAALLAWKKEGE